MLVILSLGLLLVNFFRGNLFVAAASVLVNLTLSWEFLQVIAESSNPTLSNPLWLAVLAEWIIAVAEVLAGVGRLISGRRKRY